ncbi:MFS transporter [Streptomyces sp. NPDC006530]|uniref:MFS transporter n=1 Tax=Streptomyces sp. NPDC006530 TaxID=3364750 RepID=UPI0036768AD7
MSARPRAAWPLVAVFTAGYLAAYLLPTVVGRLSAGLGLSPAEAGLVGSTLLLSSAMAGFTLASRVEQQGPRRLARWGLLLAITGYGGAALTTLTPVVVAGAVVGGLGSGTATAVAAAGIAAQRDPHRASTLGLLSVSATAGALYLTIPHLGGGHATPLASIALVAALVWPATRWLPGGSGAGVGAGGLGAGRMAGSVAPLEPVTAGEGAGGRLPHRRSGTVLAATMLCWSLAQNALWGVSGRIGLTQAGLSEVTVGMVFAAGLGAGLLGVLGAGALGARLGRAVPIGAGTAVIAGCIVVSASARGLMSFAAGEVLWNVFYPVVLSYLIGLSASLDPRGRWAVLAGSASSLGVACGPLTGSLLSQYAGYRGMGIVLCALLLLIAAPMSAVALHASGRPLVPGSIRRRGGTPAAVVAGRVGASGAGLLPQIGVREQEVAEIAIRSRARRRRKVLAS